MAAADGKDAASGAVGGVVGEVAGDLFVQNWLRGKLADPNASNVLTQQEVDALTARGVDLSKLAAGIAAASAGLDVNTAARTGGNAAQHNILPLLVFALNLTAIGLTAYDALQALKAFREGDYKKGSLIIAGIAVGWGGGYLAGKAIRATYDLMVKSGLGTAAFEFLASAAGKAGMSAEQIARLDASTASMERVVARFEAMAGKGAASAGASVSNPIPKTLVRVVPARINPNSLGTPGAADVFVADAAELQGLTASEIAKKLAIPEAKGGFRLIEFPSTSITGIATPINRTNPGFVNGGKTAGGVSEYVIPNGPIPPGATQRIVK